MLSNRTKPAHFYKNQNRSTRNYDSLTYLQNINKNIPQQQVMKNIAVDDEWFEQLNQLLLAIPTVLPEEDITPTIMKATDMLHKKYRLNFDPNFAQMLSGIVDHLSTISDYTSPLTRAEKLIDKMESTSSTITQTMSDAIHVSTTKINETISSMNTTTENIGASLQEKFSNMCKEARECSTKITEDVAIHIDGIVKMFVEFLTAGKNYVVEQIRTISIVILALVTMHWTNYDHVVVGSQLTIVIMTLFPYIKNIVTSNLPALVEATLKLREFIVDCYSSITVERQYARSGKDQVNYNFQKIEEDENDILPEKEYESINSEQHDPVHTQAEDGSTIAEILLNLFSSFAIVLGSKFTDIDIMRSLKQLGEISRHCQSIKTFAVTIQTIVGVVLNFVYSMLGIDRTALTLDSYLSGYAAFCAELEDLMRTDSMRAITTSVEINERIDAIHTQSIRNVNNLLLLRNIDANLTNHVRIMHDAAKVLLLKSVTIGPSTAPSREEPLCIMFAGPAGSGKTIVSKAIGGAFASAIYPNTTGDRLSYSRTNSGQYWDAYHQQPIVYIDDAFQTVDTAGSPNTDFIEIIRMINTSKWLVPIAECAAKATAWFKSDLIIGTTNADAINAVSIHDITAVTRRLHIDCILVPVCKGAMAVPSGKWQGHNMLSANLDTLCPDHGVDCYAFFLHDKNQVRHRNFIVPDNSHYKATTAHNFGNMKPHADKAFTFLQFMQFVNSMYHARGTKVNGVEKLQKEISNMDALKVRGQMDVPDYQSIVNELNMLKNKWNSDQLKSYLFSENDVLDITHFVITNRQYFTEHFYYYCRKTLGIITGTYERCDNENYHTIEGCTLEQLINVNHILSIQEEPHFLNQCEYDVFDSIYGDALEIRERDHINIAHVDPLELFDVLDKLPEKKFQDAHKEHIVAQQTVLSVVQITKIWHAIQKLNPTLVPDFSYTQSYIRQCFMDQEQGGFYAHELDLILKAMKIAQEVESGNILNQEIVDFVPLYGVNQYGYQLNPIEYQEVVIKHENWLLRFRERTLDTIKIFKVQVTDISKQLLDTLRAHPYYFCLGLGAALISGVNIYFMFFHKLSADGQVYIYDHIEKTRREVDKEKFDELMRYGAKGRFSRSYPGEKMNFKNNNNRGHSEAENVASDTPQCQISTTTTVMENTIFNNLCLVELYNGDNRLTRFQGLFVGDKCLITVSHMLLVYDTCTHVFVHMSTKLSPIKVHVSQISVLSATSLPKYKDRHMDLLMMKFDTNALQRTAGLIKHMPPAFTRGFTSPAELLHLVGAVGHDKPVRQTLITKAKIEPAPLSYTLAISTKLHPVVNDNTFSFSGSTKIGMCGAILFSTDDNQVQKIIGMHIAGNLSGTTGYALALDKEVVEALYDSLTKNGQIQIEVPDFLVETIPTDNEFFQGNVMPLGLIDKKVGIPTKFKSKLATTPFFETFGKSMKSPARMEPFINEDGEYVDPMSKALKRSFNEMPPMDESLIEEAVQNMKTLYRRRPDDIHVRLLTDHESIHGIADAEYFEAMALGKSPGWPHNIRTKTKRELIDTNTNLFFSHIMNEIHEIEEKAKKGISVVHLFSAFLKDEKLNHLKVLIGKSRLIYCATLALLFLIRKYFLSFTANVSRNRSKNGVCVGIDPCSPEWTRFAEDLQSKGKAIFGGDFEGFDITQNYFVTTRIVDIINEWYDDGPVNAQVRRVLWLSITQPAILYGRKVYMLDHTIPSGHPLTAVANSMYVQIVFRYVWQKVFSDNPVYADLNHFTNNVVLKVYGDDNLVNISDLVKEWFNQNTIPTHFKSIGMGYTDENKSGKEIPDYRSLEEVSFLKRMIKWSSEIVAFEAPIEVLSTDESVNYSKKEFQLVQENLEELLKENFKEYARHNDPILYKLKVDAYLDRLKQVDCDLKFSPPTFNAQREFLYYRAHPESAFGQMDTEDDTYFKRAGYEEIGEAHYGTFSSNNQSSTITKFQEDLGLVVTSKPHITKLQPFTAACKKELTVPISKMVKIANITWSIGTPTLTDIYVGDFPDDLLANPMILAKAVDFRFLRANVKLRLLINAPPTSIGKCWCWFNPMATKLGTRTPDRTLACLTGFDGFCIDAGCPATVEFEIPYCAPNNYHDLKNVLGSLGQFTITVLNPFDSLVLTDEASIQIYAWFDKVSLCVPTPNTVIAQMDEGEVKSKDGLISGIATRVKTIADYAAPVPFIGDIAKTVSWVSEAVANVASSIGFSKPTSIESVHFMHSLPAAHFTSATGLDNSVSLSLHPDNQLVPALQQFATDIDEMDINYICARKSFLTTVYWDTTQPQGTILAVYPVTPAVSSDPAVALGAGIYNTGPMAYVASMFRFWKGSLIYSVDVAKNRYYSGRIGMAFLSGYKTSEVSAVTNFDAAYRMIVDLTENSVAQFKVEYQTMTPWLSVDFTNASEADNQDYNSSLGCFVIYIDNKLSVQSNVPTTIPINIWISGGKDLAFSVPDFGSYGPYAQMEVFDPVIAQVGNENDPVPGQTRNEQISRPQTTTLNSESNPIRLDGEKFCMGESVKNLRLITRRFGVQGETSGRLFRLDTSYYGERTTGISINRGSNVPLFYISWLYRFYTGSRRYKFVNMQANPTPAPATDVKYLKAWLGFEYVSNPFGIQLSADADLNGGFRSEVATEQSNMLEIAIPYYRSKNVSLVSSLKFQTEDFRPTVSVEQVTKDSGEVLTSNMRFLVAAGDDFTYGYLIGTPTITRLDGQ